MKTAEARAFANIALIKYFGKRHRELNLPAASSLSVTLDPLETRTRVSFFEEPGPDEILLNGSPADDRFSRRVTTFLSILRKQTAYSAGKARVETTNTFPTAAGLASSASGFAALAVASTSALGIELSPRQMSALARRGSGSAARSISGGFVLWHRGTAADGEDSVGESIAPSHHMDVRVLVGISDPGPKFMGSTEAMEHTRQTSCYYNNWIRFTENAVKEAVAAVRARDLEKVGELTEASALAMHAVAMSARPGIIYFNGVTVEAVHLVRTLRRDGLSAWFTCDAGPQPKILCAAQDAPIIARRFEELPGIQRILHCHPAEGASLITDGG